MGVVLALVVMGTLTADPNTDTTAGQAPTTEPATEPPAAETTDTETTDTTEPETTEEPTTTAKPQPTVLFSQSGSGSHSLQPFNAPDEWRLGWSYNCSNFGTEGNFIVLDEGGGSVNINELGKSGRGTEFIDGGGRIKLQTISECRWTLKAISGH